jgi:hypothetical protein
MLLLKEFNTFCNREANSLYPFNPTYGEVGSIKGASSNLFIGINRISPQYLKLINPFLNHLDRHQINLRGQRHLTFTRKTAFCIRSWITPQQVKSCLVLTL